MQSFYGGPNGQNFQIKAIFTSKNGGTDSLQHDLSLGWNSPIHENEIVVVSYGLPSDPNYNKYKELDIELEGKSYNSTLWLKCYDETQGNANGWYYKLIASMTGNTPRLYVNQPIEILDADQPPKVTINNGDVDNPVLFFALPQSQILSVNQPTIALDPVENARVVYDEKTNINRPTLQFYIPRAAKFYYGNLLGERALESYTLQDESFADYGVGDYYINQRTGFIYYIARVDGITCTFNYVACIQSPLPIVDSIGISPYTEDGEINKPTVERSFIDSEQTAWKLEFGIPNAPKAELDAKFVGPTVPGSADVSITDKDTLTFKFNIPTGTKIFTGTLVSSEDYTAEVPGARIGDIYLNSDTGTIYVLQESGIWELQKDSNLKGPPGDALHIVRDYRLTVGENGMTNSLSDGVQYIKDNYLARPFKTDEIFAITWVTGQDEEDSYESSYWYYCTDPENDIWGRAQLTGSVMNLIKDDGYHDGSPEDGVDIQNTTYSIRYINSLIGGNIDTSRLDRTAFSKSQIYTLLGWGDWDDAKKGEDFPLPDNYNTLSVEEVIDLMSWGKFSDLTKKGN